MRPVPVLLSLSALVLACDGAPVTATPRSPAPPLAMMTTAAPAEPGAAASTPAPAPVATRGEVVLVELGPPFPADLRTAVEEALRDELAVEVVWHERIALPRAAWYAPRKRWRADVILEHLVTLVPEAPASTRVLGLTTAFATPAMQAILPALVPREDLPAAVAMNSVTFNLARAIGPVMSSVACESGRAELTAMPLSKVAVSNRL